MIGLILGTLGLAALLEESTWGGCGRFDGMPEDSPAPPTVTFGDYSDDLRDWVRTLDVPPPVKAWLQAELDLGHASRQLKAAWARPFLDAVKRNEPNTLLYVQALNRAQSAFRASGLTHPTREAAALSVAWEHQAPKARGASERDAPEFGGAVPPSDDLSPLWDDLQVYSDRIKRAAKRAARKGRSAAQDDTLIIVVNLGHILSDLPMDWTQMPPTGEPFFAGLKSGSLLTSIGGIAKALEKEARAWTRTAGQEEKNSARVSQARSYVLFLSWAIYQLNPRAYIWRDAPELENEGFGALPPPATPPATSVLKSAALAGVPVSGGWGGSPWTGGGGMGGYTAQNLLLSGSADSYARRIAGTETEADFAVIGAGRQISGIGSSGMDMDSFSDDIGDQVLQDMGL